MANWNNNNSNTEAKREPFNVCENWGLRCFSMKDTQKNDGVILNCGLNPAQKREDGSYGKALSVNVVCKFDTCDIKEDDYSNKSISVWGRIQLSEYKSNKTGEYMPQLTIFADKVRETVFPDKK